MGVEERTNVRQVWHEQEMYEVNVQRSASNILQRRAHHGKFREVLLVGAEVHEYDGEQQELRQRQGNDGPRHSHVVPFQRVERTENDDNYEQREEPLRVHDALGLLPIAMDDVAVEEEGEIEKHLTQAGVHQEIA